MGSVYDRESVTSLYEKLVIELQEKDNVSETIGERLRELRAEADQYRRISPARTKDGGEPDWETPLTGIERHAFNMMAPLVAERYILLAVLYHFLQDDRLTKEYLDKACEVVSLRDLTAEDREAPHDMIRDVLFKA